MDFINKLYANQYVYHHLHWLQSSLCSNFLEQHGADSQEMKMAEGHMNLETIWPKLCRSVQTSFAQVVFVKGMQSTVDELTIAVKKLVKFSKLTLSSRTKYLDVFFPSVKSGEFYKHNLHTCRLGERNAIWMIGLMDMTNWNAWSKLLNKLDDETKASLPNVLIHTSIRNDNHCPTCRLHFVTVHWTNNNDMDLKLGCSEWIDEWKRRQNGDLYHFFKLQDEIVYDLQTQDLGGHPSVSCKKDNKPRKQRSKMLYMFLQIEIDKRLWCPDNIQFTISFHKTFRAAFTRAKNVILDTGKYETLRQTHTLCECDDENICHTHLQIVSLSQGQTYCLNSSCSFIDIVEWDKT